MLSELQEEFIDMNTDSLQPSKFVELLAFLLRLDLNGFCNRAPSCLKLSVRKGNSAASSKKLWRKVTERRVGGSTSTLRPKLHDFNKTLVKKNNQQKKNRLTSSRLACDVDALTSLA